MKARGEPVDVVTIAAELRSRDKLGTVGDTRYLGDLSDAVVTLAHLEQHARIVADLAQLRRVVATAQQIAARALGQRGPVAEFVAWAEKATMAACERQTRTGLRPLRDFLEQSFARIEQQGGDVAPGMLTGFHALDALTHGLHGGQLIVVAARPRMGAGPGPRHRPHPGNETGRLS